ncbi:MAG: ECF transporter S component [Clostridia bacterium]|nr:ECF transporter S component [Clostridia bacterium]
MQKNNVKKISVTALFCAIAFLMTFVFRFKVGFLTFDLKDAVISVISLLYGPIYGVASAGVVAVLELLSVSDTGLYGLIMNFISSATFAIACGSVYKFKRSFSGAIIAVVVSVISVTAIMMVANIFITPYYMGVETAEIIALIPTMLFPFNLCKSIVNAASLLIIYKPITNALKKTGLVVANKTNYKFSKKSVILFVVSLAVLALAVCFIIFKMGGSFSFLK